jgi:hypothetical protein
VSRPLLPTGGARGWGAALLAVAVLATAPGRAVGAPPADPVAGSEDPSPGLSRHAPAGPGGAPAPGALATAPAAPSPSGPAPAARPPGHPLQVAQSGARRVEASLACAATGTPHVYDCALALSRGGRPLTGVSVIAGADMPSMPMAHAVRPVTATPGPEPGEYRFRLALEMRGEWAVRLRLGGAVRDQLILHYAFDGATATPVPR